MKLDRYQMLAAAGRVDQYYFPRPEEEFTLGKEVDTFKRAKSETIKVIERALEEVRTLEAEDFFALKKAGKIPDKFWPWQRDGFKITFKIHPHHEPGVGIDFYGDTVTIEVESGDPGGDPGEFAERMKKALESWYDFKVEEIK